MSRESTKRGAAGQARATAGRSRVFKDKSKYNRAEFQRVEEENMYIIQDWAGNRMFLDNEFNTFEDGWEFIYEKFPNEEDWQEMLVVLKD